MKITLAHAISMRSNIQKHVTELYDELNRVSTSQAEKGETPKDPTRSVKMVLADILKAEGDLLQLEHLMKEQNLANGVEWDGAIVCLADAITVAEQMRKRAGVYKGMGKRKKTERTPGRGLMDSSNLLTVCHYEPDEYRQAGQKLERQANYLSQLVQDKNGGVQFEFSAAEFYLS